mgnify:FL=1
MDIFTKNKPFDRNERFSNEIMKVLNDIFIRELELSSLGFITIKNVSLTKDLKIAKIYISSINSKFDNKEIIKYFIKNKKLIRGFLGKSIKSRNVPELRFFYDDSNEIAEDIDKLFNSINKNKNWFYLLINQLG